MRLWWKLPPGEMIQFLIIVLLLLLLAGGLWRLGDIEWKKEGEKVRSQNKE